MSSKVPKCPLPTGLLKLLALGLPQRTSTICINVRSLAQKNVGVKEGQEKLDIMTKQKLENTNICLLWTLNLEVELKSKHSSEWRRCWHPFSRDNFHLTQH